MFKPRTIISVFTAIILALVTVIQVDAQPALATVAPCSETAVTPASSPTTFNRPILPSTAPLDTATFVDPTAIITTPTNITLGEKIYVGPFARIDATSAPVSINHESNVQDQVNITPSGTGVTIGKRVILAHHVTIKGAAKIGVGGSTGPFIDPVTNTSFSNPVPETFLAFNAEVDGATIQCNTVISFLARVGHDVTLPSGKVVLPGKNVTTNAQASDGSLGKVANLSQADVALMQGIIEVNEALAKGYAGLAQANLSNVTGINLAPTTSFNTGGLPKLAGVSTQDPTYRNRIIGDASFEDSRADLNNKLGSRISIRADEGQPFTIGRLAGIANDVVFHALETTSVTVGTGNGYGPRTLVHGGRLIVNGAANGPETSLGNDVGLGPNVVIFRAVVGDKSAVGQKSAVFNSTLAPRTHIKSKIIYADNGNLVAQVEW